MDHASVSASELPGPIAPQRDADEIRSVVRLVVGNAQTGRRRNERRRERRYPFPYPISLTPLDSNNTPLMRDTIVVVGKTLSEMGMDFYYKEAVPYRRAIAWLPCGSNRVVGLVVELNWCRFNGNSWYENGGKFSLRRNSQLRLNESDLAHLTRAVEATA
jgi:hypothetical protein